MGTIILGFAGVSVILSALLAIALCRLNSPISREEEEREWTETLKEYQSRQVLQSEEKT